MNQLLVMCGLQGSGKSHFAREYKKEYSWMNCVILSSDEIRKEFPNYDNEKVFKKLYDRMNKAFKDSNRDEDTLVIIDATNTTIKSRKKLLDSIENKEDVYKRCMIINTPYEICLERVRERNKKPDSHYVPEDVLEKYYRSFEIPFKEEGWNEVELAYYTFPKHSEKYLSDLWSRARYFNQHNKHHTQLLGQHLESVYNYLNKNINMCKDSLLMAGKYHDIGKLFTQKYKDGDPNAHYYDHANVGAYNLLCFACMTGNWAGFDVNKTLDWLFYINYHMKMHDIKTDKLRSKWELIFGSKKFNDLENLYKADCYRPEEPKNEDDDTPKANKKYDNIIEQMKCDTRTYASDLDLYEHTLKTRLWHCEPIRASQPLYYAPSTNGTDDIQPIDLLPVTEIRRGGLITDEDLPF